MNQKTTLSAIVGLIILVTSSCVSAKKYSQDITALRSQQTLSEQKIKALENTSVKHELTLLNIDSLTVKKKEIPVIFSNNAYEIYGVAQKSGDIPTAVQALTILSLTDSSSASWVYDSLTFYQFFYMGNPGSRNPSIAMFYAEKGLKVNPKNIFLLEIKAKLLLEVNNDTTSYQILESLWERTHDYTFWWDLTFIEVARGNLKKAESMVKTAMNAADLNIKTVRMEVHTDKVREEVPAKAAFMFMRSMIMNSKRDYQNAYTTLKEIQKKYPNFYSVSKNLYEMERAMSGQ